MRKMLNMLCIIVLASSHKGIYISVFNKTNDVTVAYCYYDYHSIDSVYLYPNDSSLLAFYTFPFVSWEKIPSLFVRHLDSIKVQTSNKTVMYWDKRYIYNFLINNKDTANIIRTKVHLLYLKYKFPDSYQEL